MTTAVMKKRAAVLATLRLTRTEVANLLRSRMSCASRDDFEPFLAGLYGDRQSIRLSEVLEAHFIDTPMSIELTPEEECTDG